MKWNKENACVNAGCLSKQELGGVQGWPLRARTSQSPSAKQLSTRQLTEGHRPLLPLSTACLQKSQSPPCQSFHLSPEHHQPRQEIETVWNHERWEWRLRSRYYLADMICLECGSASVNLNRHASNVTHNNRRVKQSSAVLTWVHELFSELHKAHDSYTTSACKIHSDDLQGLVKVCIFLKLLQILSCFTTPSCKM